MIKPDKKSKVTIEDLLRLKRAEQPGPEFWVKFEQELRQKQLTALVQKRRWWHTVPVLLHRRFHLPVGAAAIAVFTMVTVRYTTPNQVVQETNTIQQIAAENAAIETLANTVVAVHELEQVRQQDEAITVAMIAAAAPITQDERADDSTVSRESSTWDVDSLSARSLTTNLGRLQPSEPELLSAVLGNRLRSPAPVPSTETASAELASIPNASGSKYHLIARYADRTLSPAPSAPAVVRERLARRLGDDLGDDISRIGVVGSRVSLKF